MSAALIMRRDCCRLSHAPLLHNSCSDELSPRAVGEPAACCTLLHGRSSPPCTLRGANPLLPLLHGRSSLHTSCEVLGPI